MITYHTNMKIPEAILAEAQRRANESGQPQFLAYLRAGDVELNIVTEAPAVGLVAEVTAA